MATTRGWAMKGNIVNLVNYILDIGNGESKTENGHYVIASNSELPMSEAFKWKKSQTDSHSESVGYHFQLSLPSGEGSADDCMMLAEEWINAISDGKANYIIAVHTNTNNIHAHIAANYYLNDGKPWKIYWKRDQKRFREISDRICVKHGFSVLEETRNRSQTYFEWLGEHSDNNRDVIKKIMDTVIPKAASYNDFKNYMECMGFKIYDDMKSTDANVFQFTVNVKLIHEEEDGSYMVRIPYDTQYVRVEPVEFEWLTEDKTARITIPIDKDVSVFDSGMAYKGLKDAEELKRLFEDKTKGKRKGLRIRMPESKYIVRTNRLEPNEDGLGYTLEDVMQRINNNGRIINTRDIQSALDSQGDFDKVMQARRNLYESANVKFDPTTTLFKSVRQESYFRWKATEVQKVMNRMNYRNLLQHDRENIDKLKSRRFELQKQIDEVNHLLENVDNTVEMMTEQKIENVMDISDEEIETFISENRNPLIEKKEKLKKMIGLYSERINTVDNQNQYKSERERSEHVR